MRQDACSDDHEHRVFHVDSGWSVRWEHGIRTVRGQRCGTLRQPQREELSIHWHRGKCHIWGDMTANPVCRRGLAIISKIDLWSTAVDSIITSGYSAQSI